MAGKASGIVNPMLAAPSTDTDLLPGAGAGHRDGGLCLRLATSTAFQATELALLLLTVVSLAIDSPTIPPGPTGSALVSVAEMVTNVVWSLQLAIKIVAYTPRGYVLEAPRGAAGGHIKPAVQWLNLLDIVVVVSGWLVMIPAFQERGAGNARLLRLLRGVPIIASWSTDLGDLISALGNAIPALRDVFLFCLFVIFGYAVLGLHLYQGVLSYRCATVSEVATGLAIGCPHTLDCDRSSGGMCTRHNPPITVSDKENYGLHGFDHLLQSAFTVISQMSLDGGFHDLPSHLHSGGTRLGAWSFFASLVVVANVLVLNLFVAVIVSAFHDKREASKTAPHDGRALTVSPRSADAGQAMGFGMDVRAARAGEDAQIELMRIKEDRKIKAGSGLDAVVNACYSVAISPAFEWSTLGAIGANVAVLCIYHDGMSDDLRDTLTLCEVFFLIIFSVEATIKLIAFGFREYMKSGLNKMDLLVLCISSLGIVANHFVDHDDESMATNLSALRVLRLTRLIGLARVIYKYESVLQVVETAFQSTPQLLSLCLIMLLTAVFATLGAMHLFGGFCAECAERQSDHYLYTTKDMQYSDHYSRRNFESFGVGLISTSQFITNDGWFLL
jgi:voltage-dependent calcium channel T type alpha-1I